MGAAAAGGDEVLDRDGTVERNRAVSSHRPELWLSTDPDSPAERPQVSMAPPDALAIVVCHHMTRRQRDGRGAHTEPTGCAR